MHTDHLRRASGIEIIPMSVQKIFSYAVGQEQSESPRIPMKKRESRSKYSQSQKQRSPSEHSSQSHSSSGLVYSIRSPMVKMRRSNMRKQQRYIHWSDWFWWWHHSDSWTSSWVLYSVSGVDEGNLLFIDMRSFLCILLFAMISLSPVFAGEGYIVNTIGSTQHTASRKRLIENVLDASVMGFWYSVLSIIIDANQREPRGKMQWHTITISWHIQKEGEFLKLLIHEIGHYVDIYILVGTTFSPDASNGFYDISWIGTSIKKSNETLSSFVSGYAASNRYEDFAESFVFYIFHNREFADRAVRNDSLRQKYLFFSENIFPTWVFVDTDFRIGKIPSYLWDTTKIPISVQKYLYSL